MNSSTLLMPEDPGEELLRYSIEDFRKRSFGARSLRKLSICLSSGISLFLFLILFLVFFDTSFYKKRELFLLFILGVSLFSIGGSVLIYHCLVIGYLPSKLEVVLYSNGLDLTFSSLDPFSKRFLSFEVITSIDRKKYYGEEDLRIAGGPLAEGYPFHLPSTQHDEAILAAYNEFKAEEGGSSL